MKRKREVLSIVRAGLIVLGLLSLVACTTTSEPWGDTETGLVLTYRMGDGNPYSYSNSYTFDQVISVEGREISIQIAVTTGFSVIPRGLSAANQELGVKLDKVEVFITTPQGRMAPDTTPVIGKSFDMVLSPRGEEVELKGTEDLVYEVAPGKSRNVSAFFQNIFPDLPEGAIRVGDSWTSSDIVEDKSKDGEVIMTFNNNHTLDGYETIDGYECARIKNTFTGKLSGKAKEGPMDLDINGIIEGSETWYFAYREGVLVKSTATGTSKGTIKGTGPQEITIPDNRVFKFEMALLK